MSSQSCFRFCYHIYQNEENALYWAAADYAFDLVYIFDTLVIRTRLQFLDEAGIFEKNRGKTIRNFIRNGTFKVDMASLLPLDLLYFATGTIHILRQQRDWVGGSKKWPANTVFMLTTPARALSISGLKSRVLKLFTIFT